MTEMTTSRAAEVAGYLKQWMFDPNHAPHPLLAKPSFTGPTDRNTNLKNSRERKFLQWEKQTFGINLGWTDDASPATAVRISRWFFTLPTDDSSPLRYGQPIAWPLGWLAGPGAWARVACGCDGPPVVAGAVNKTAARRQPRRVFLILRGRPAAAGSKGPQS